MKVHNAKLQKVAILIFSPSVVTTGFVQKNEKPRNFIKMYQLPVARVMNTFYVWNEEERGAKFLVRARLCYDQDVGVQIAAR
jgi:hypothetical protein